LVVGGGFVTSQAPHGIHELANTLQGMQGIASRRFPPRKRDRKIIMPRWTKGRSGNPKGRPKRGHSFSDALDAKGTAEELAELAWKAARAGEPWAIQMIYNRLEPQPAQLNLTQEVDNGNTIDYGRLTSEEINQMESLLERASTPVDEIESGESPTPAT
jgi:hypothetical protein